MTETDLDDAVPRKRTIRLGGVAAIGLAFFTLIVPLRASELPDADAYHASVEQWKSERLERLMNRRGFLSLAGLYWLRPGANRFGSAPDNDLAFPATAPRNIGVLTLEDDAVRIEVAPGVGVLHEDNPVSAMSLADDRSESPAELTLGSLSWYVINRNGKFAVRLTDSENLAFDAFPGIESYPIDPKWRVKAFLRQYDEPRQLRVDTVVEGLDFEPYSPGVLEFELDGQQMELEAYASGDQLFLVFADRTSGRETYGAGRYLYTALPDDGGVTVVDFNRAYNPPCVFNDFATCPVASGRNRLKLAVRAGEKYSDKLYVGAPRQ